MDRLHFNADKVFDSRCQHGEGPHWNATLKKLFWVDIEGQSLLCGDPLRFEVKTYKFDKKITAVASTDTPDEMVLALSDSVVRFSLHEERILSEFLLPELSPATRLNDGKVAPDGHFLIGSMNEEKPERAKLYSFDFESGFTELLDKVSVSNGLDWRGDLFLYVDSPTKELKHFRWPPSPSLEGQLRMSVPLDLHGKEELPDGMCLDQSGDPWIAIWGGGRVSRFDKDSGKETARIELTCPYVSSCCFGGSDLNRLYITTASKDDRSNNAAGYVYAADLGSLKGKKPTQMRLPSLSAIASL